jgi:hypothetical protein
MRTSKTKRGQRMILASAICNPEKSTAVILRHKRTWVQPSPKFFRAGQWFESAESGITILPTFYE